MSTVSGVVTDVTAERKISSRTGKPYSVYSIAVNGDWFEAGFKSPCSVGDSVTFDYTLSYGKNKITDGTLSKGSASFAGARPAVASAPTTTSRAGGSGSATSSKPFPIPKNHGDRSIIRQNSLTQARELMVATGYMSHFMPKGATPMSEEQLDSVASQVIALASRFEAYASGEVGGSPATVQDIISAAERGEVI